MINIKKSSAPTDPFKYNDEDIKEQIRNDFFCLCYICEEYVPVSYEIDHFFPKGVPQFADLEHDWDNLFCCCSKCNKERPKKLNTTGREVLNNCVDDVEGIIFIWIENGVVKMILNTDDDKTRNTKRLLNRLFNGINAPDKEKRSYIHRREAVQKVIDKFENYIAKYYKNKDLFEDEIKERLSKKTMSESSAYVSFKRQLVRMKYQELTIFFD